MDLDFNDFVRKPFTVKAVEITEENIEECSKFIGELKKNKDGSPYILVDRRIIPNIHRVYPGFWMTQMGDNIRCYAPHIFSDQFTPANNTVMEWVEYLNKNGSEKTKDPQPTEAG